MKIPWIMICLLPAAEMYAYLRDNMPGSIVEMKEYSIIEVMKDLG